MRIRKCHRQGCADVLTRVPCHREFEIMDCSRPIHGDPGQHATRDPVVQVWPAPGLDHVASQRGQYLATLGTSRDDRIAQLLERLRGQDLGETVQPVLQRAFPTPGTTKIAHPHLARPIRERLEP